MPFRLLACADALWVQEQLEATWNPEELDAVLALLQRKIRRRKSIIFDTSAPVDDSVRPTPWRW